jgi:hypothetical protein
LKDPCHNIRSVQGLLTGQKAGANFRPIGVCRHGDEVRRLTRKAYNGHGVHVHFLIKAWGTLNGGWQDDPSANVLDTSVTSNLVRNMKADLIVFFSPQLFLIESGPVNACLIDASADVGEKLLEKVFVPMQVAGVVPNHDEEAVKFPLTDVLVVGGKSFHIVPILTMGEKENVMQRIIGAMHRRYEMERVTIFRTAFVHDNGLLRKWQCSRVVHNGSNLIGISGRIECSCMLSLGAARLANDNARVGNIWKRKERNEMGMT